MIDSAHLFVLAILVFLFGLVSRLLSRTIVTGPLAFVLFGMVLAPVAATRMGLGSFFGPIDNADSIIHLLGEITLVVLLFTDAAQIQLSKLVRGAAIPARLLGIGMPLTIIFGAALAMPLFRDLGWWEAALLAVMLAPTDAALGQAVVSSELVPLRIRQGLSVESGLNDGMAVPLVLVFASIASIGHGAVEEEMTATECALFAGKQVVFGPLAGIVVGAAGAWLMRFAVRRAWMERTYRELAGIALAIIAYVAAGLIGGNGFIAAFVAGLVMGNSSKEVCGHLYDFAEAEAQLLMLSTFFLVGLTLAGEPLTAASWEVWVYSALSLTVIRMLPVAMSMLGLGLKPGTIIFLGWFGPRGLASILFAILLIEELPVPHSEEIVQIVLVTALLSVLAHGITAAPLSAWYARTLDRSKSTHEFGGVPSGLVRKKMFNIGDAVDASSDGEDA